MKADKADIERFLDLTFRYADPDSFVSLRAFDQLRDGEPPILIRTISMRRGLGHIADAAVMAAESTANRADPGVFCPPIATFKGWKATVENLANGLVLSVEMDKGDAKAARERLESLIGPATVIVHSGGAWINPETGEVHPKAHIHWRLSEPTGTPDDHAELREARRLAALLVGADDTAVPIPHPLRWPGSWHLKAAPRMARIAAANPDAEIHLHDALPALSDAVEAAGLASQSDGQRVHIPGKNPQADVAIVSSAVAAIPNRERDWRKWNRIGMAIWRATGGSSDGLKIFQEWSEKVKLSETDTCAARWSVYPTCPPTKIGAGTLFFEATAAGWHRPTPFADTNPLRPAAEIERAISGIVRKVASDPNDRLFWWGCRRLHEIAERGEVERDAAMEIARAVGRQTLMPPRARELAINSAFGGVSHHG